MRSKNPLCLLLAFFLIALGAVQAQTAAPREVAVHAGRLIDVRTGQVTKDAYVVIQGDRILSIASSAPKDDAVIDMSQYTIVPGLVDCHAHILSDPTTQTAGKYLMTSAPPATVRGVANLQIWLAHGLTALS